MSAIGTFVVALALYLPTLMPTVGFWDTAEFQTVGPILGIAHPTGFPSYVLLTWAASIVLSPFGNTAFRIDLFSAILVAGAAALLAATVQRLTGRIIPGVAAGLLLASAPITWWTAERADPHALHLFLSALLLFLLVAWAQRVRETDPGRVGATDPVADRLLLAASAVYAVALGNHALTVLLAPGILLLLLAVQPQLFTRRPGFVLACAGVIAAITIVCYAYIPIRASMNPPLDYAHPTTPGRFAYLVLGLQFRGLLQNPLIGGPGAIFDILASQLSAAVLAAAAAGFVAAVIGLGRLRGPGVAIAAMTATWFVIVTVFARAYNDGFPDRYYLVPLAMIALWAGVAASVAWDVAGYVLDGLGSRSVPRLIRAGAFVLAAVVVLALPAQRAIAGQTEQAGATDSSGAAWLDAAYAVLPRDAVVISWWSYSTTLWYGRWIEGRRPDVQIVDDRNLLDDGYEDVQNAIAHFEALRRPIYLIRQPGDIPALEEQYHLVEHATIPGYSPLWEVVPGPAPTGACMPSRTSFRRTTRRRTSGSWSRRRWRLCPPWPTGSRSSRWTTEAPTRRRPSPTSWQQRTPTSFGPCTTRRTSGTAPRCAVASRRRGTRSSDSRTETGSFGSRTWGGCLPSSSRRQPISLPAPRTGPGAGVHRTPWSATGCGAPIRSCGWSMRGSTGSRS